MIPNIITTFRLFLVPLFSYLLLIADNLWGASIVLALSGLSDIIDGIIARKYNMITEIGKVYDPLVDKLMQITVLFGLAVKGLIPFWFISIIIAKELIMILASLVLYIKKIIVQAKWYGKMSTVIFYAVMFFHVLLKDIPYSVSMILLLILVASMLFSLLAYCGQFISSKKEVEQIENID